MQIIRVPSWRIDYCEAEYWGRKHSVQIGPFLIFWGQIRTTRQTHTANHQMRESRRIGDE